MLFGSVAAGTASLAGKGQVGAQVAVVLTNLCLGVLLLALSDSVFQRVEMREFEDH